jgi:hypothetical protein
VPATSEDIAIAFLTKWGPIMLWATIVSRRFGHGPA